MSPSLDVGQSHRPPPDPEAGARAADTGGHGQDTYVLGDGALSKAAHAGRAHVRAPRARRHRLKTAR